MPHLPNLQGLSMPKTCDSLEMFWNSKLLFADRISALSRFDLSGKDFKGGIDCTAASTRELGVISSAAAAGEGGQKAIRNQFGD